MTPGQTDMIVLLLAGLAGGIGVGAALPEHSLGTLKNALVGVIGGAIGYVLQKFLPLPSLAVSGGDPVLDVSPAEHLMVQGLVGVAAGALFVAVLGFVIVEARRHAKPK
jgi:uncharacterized membrane protein YeaQ/YmgE (transglycosylase-associated protein family)